VVKIIIKHRGFIIDITQERFTSVGTMTYYRIVRNSDGWVFADNSSNRKDDLNTYVKYLKEDIDEYIRDPSEWESVKIDLINEEEILKSSCNSMGTMD
jgi:hypothetical protein